MAYTNSTDDLIWGGVDSDRESGTMNIWLYLDSDSVPSSNSPVELLTDTRQFSAYYRDRIRWRIEYDSANGARARLQLNSPAADAVSAYSCDMALTSDGVLGWHMQTISWNKSTGELDFYLDGAANGSSTDVIPAMSVPSSDTFVAGQITGPYKAGDIGIAKTAHLAVWKAAQVSSDIAQLYTAMTSNLAISFTVFAGATGVTAVFENPSASPGYVTKLDIYGKRLKVYQPNTYTYIDDASQFVLGQLKGELDMTYQNDPLVGKDTGDFMGSFMPRMRTAVDKVSIDAFRNSSMQTEALSVEPGDRITLTNTHLGVSRDYWVNGIESSLIGPNLLTTTLYVTQAFDVNFWALGVTNYSELGQSTYLSY